jgi:hypothetical protein
MSWAARRRFLILFILAAIAVAIVALIAIATFTKAPSCSDGLQNQGEAGVDCGGPCAYLCSDQAHAPTVLFTKALANGSGRTDVIASIENVNGGAAAKNVPYTVTLYGAGQVFVQQVTGTIDLPPSAKVPVFIPNISSGHQSTIRAFLTIDPAALFWYTLDPTTLERPMVVDTKLGGATSTPRIDATLSNGTVGAMTNVPVIVMVHDARGEVIAASRTIVANIPPQGKAVATFTWNSAFTAEPAQIEVIPIVSLP